MKRIATILIVLLTCVAFAGDFSGWHCIESCFETGNALMIDAAEPLSGSVCRSPLFQVEEGTDYILTFLTDNALTAGELDLELKGYSDYDGTEASVRKMRLLSTLNGAPMKGGQCRGIRTWRCAFTVPSDVKVFQARINGKDAQGRLTLKEWALAPGDIGPQHWYYGTKGARIMLRCFQQGMENSVLEFRNVTVTAEP